MKKTCKYFLFVAIIGMLACDTEKMPLPSPRNTEVSFSANDTSYVELNPVWTADYLGVSLSAPSDLALGPDGVLFLADQGSDRIHAFSKAGVRLMDQGLQDISGVAGPTGLSVDSKLNLLIVNGTSTIYAWNQYLNHVQIDSVATTGVYWDRTQNDTLHLTFSQLLERASTGQQVPSLRYFLFKKDEEVAATAKGVYPFYQDGSSTAMFNGVTAGKYGSDYVYTTDSSADRILQLKIVPDLAIKSSDRQVLFHYRAIFQKVIASYGSGSGTVDEPRAITTDRDENLYFTQLGGNFRVQKLAATTFEPRYVLYQHEIMDLDRFIAPYDVALDDAGNIFVMDSQVGSVFKFGNAGIAAGQLINLGKKGLAVTTFGEGRGLLVSENVVYVVEQTSRRIRRFQYSVSDSDIPDDQKKP